MRTSSSATTAPTATWSPLGIGELVGVLLLVAFGAVLRAHGFTSQDLWFDDAWVALAAKVGIGQALHMGLAAPGYFLALRAWITLDPGTTAWLQLPGFALGVLAIPATWLLLRWYGFSRWIAVGGALLVTVMPILVLYSTRVKEYPFDFLAACGLLAVYEGVRRRPSARLLAALGVASVVAVFASGSCVVVVVASWLLVVVQLARDRALRAALVTWAAVAAGGCVLAWALFFRSLPDALYRYWRVRGYLFDFHSVATLEKSVSLTFGGFAHEAFGIPAAPTFFRYSDGFHSTSLTFAGIVVFLAVVGGPVVLAARARAVTPALASVTVLGLALALAVLGVAPFGDGRTDEVVYPAMLICLATSVDALARWWRTAPVGRGAARLAAGALATLVVVGALAFGALHPADYPSIDLRGLSAQLRPDLRPGDRVFVATFNSFGWCYYRLSPCTVVVGGSPQWVQGFRPSTREPTFVATSEQSVLPQILPALHGSRIWYVGYTYGTYDVAAAAAAQDRPVPTQMLRVLERHGWVLAPPRAGLPARVASTHTYAWLLVPRRATGRPTSSSP
jgi:hypothetical protein